MLSLSSLRVFHSDRFSLPLPPNHRFPMKKYQIIRERLISDKVLTPENLKEASFASEKDILRAHSLKFYQSVKDGTLTKKEQRLIGFPWSEVMLKRSLSSVGGLLNAIDSALEVGISGNLSGGTHHSFSDHGEGFCVFNDFAIAALKCIEEKSFQDILILDLDVHQGNGNAKILKYHEEVFVVSMHGATNYPYRKQTSDIDIDLKDETQDDEYLAILENLLKRLSQRRWDIILYQAGVDPLKEDSLGKLSLSQKGLKKRDQLVFEFGKKKGIPIAIALGGGYSIPIEHTISSHLNTYRAIKEVYF